MKPGAPDHRPPAAAGRTWLVTALLFLGALALYWPVATWFQGDDYIAIPYAYDLGRTAHDFTGPQYGLTGHTLFWRPLITLSFAVEGHLWGGAPWGYHLTNALCHALNTLLLLAVLTRLVGRRWAVRTALLWALHPAQALTTMWIVGRVDLHSVFWILLCLLGCLRQCESWKWKVVSLFAAIAAFATKETAIILPPLVGLVALFDGERASLGERLRRAVARAWPFFVLLALYFLVRRYTLGEAIGGYKAEQPDYAWMIPGLGRWVTRLLTPLDSSLGVRALGAVAPWLARGGLVLWLALLILGVRKGPAAENRPGLALGLLWFLGTCVPVYTFLAQYEELKHLRYFYLPLAGLLLAASAGGWRPTLVLLLLLAPVHLPIRQDFAAAYRYNREVHTGLARIAGEIAGRPDYDPERPLVVADHELDPGISWRLFLGLDRVLLPPLGPGGPPILRWRPFYPEVMQPLRYEPEQSGFPLPLLVRVDRRGRCTLDPLKGPGLPPLRVEPTHPQPLAGETLGVMALGGGDHPLRTRPAVPGLYRILVMTQNRYMSCRIPSNPDGSLSLRRLLLAKTTRQDRGVALMVTLAMCLDIAPQKAAWLHVARLDPATRKPVAATRKPIMLLFDESAERTILGGR